MAHDIDTYTIGVDLKADPDYFFEGQIMANIESPVVLAGRVTNQIDIVGVVTTELAFDDTDALTLTLNYAETIDESGDLVTPSSVQVFTYTESGGGSTTAIDTELFRYAPTMEKGSYWTVTMAITNTPTGNIDVYPALVG